MADLKFGNVTPSIGDIKVGSNDVSRIYQGTTEVWPGCSPITPAETEINGLVWQNKNSVITTRTNGGTIPIVTSSSAWNSAYSAGTPAATYWNFNSSNSEIGLYYNIYCLSTIQPPTGFRVPTFDDMLNIANATTGTEISNNDCGFWPSEINSNPNLNTINWNSNGRGFILVDPNTDEVIFYNDYGRNPMSVYWYRPQPTQTGRTGGFGTRYRNNLGPAIHNGLPEFLSSDPKKDSGYHIRFVKDAPPPVQLYDNDQQTGPPVSQLDISFNSPSGGGISPSNYGSLVVDPSGTNWSPSIQTCVNQTFSGTNPIMRILSFDVEIFSNANRTSLVATFSKNFTGTSDQTVACSTPTISTFSDQAFAGGTYYIKRTITFNTSGSLGVPPFTYTFLLE